MYIAAFINFSFLITFPSALADPDVQRRALDEARLNRLFDELSFGGMLRQRCLNSA